VGETWESFAAAPTRALFELLLWLLLLAGAIIGGETVMRAAEKAKRL
jgi:hypothetical protein